MSVRYKLFYNLNVCVKLMKDKIENIFKLVSSPNTKFFFHNDILQIIYIPSDKDSMNPKIKVKTDCKLKLIVGFSMNIKSLNIRCDEGDQIQLNGISNVHMNLSSGDIIEFIPEPAKYCEIYIKFKDIISFDSEISDISYSKYYILDETKTNPNLKLKVEVNKTIQPVKFNRIIIVLTKFIKSIGEYFKIIYKRRGIDVEIKTTPITFDDCLESIASPETIYLILFNSSDFNLLPNRFIFYQIEQERSIFMTDKLYLKRFKYMCGIAEYIWVYTDICKVVNKYCPKDKLKWVPMPFVYLNNLNTKYLVNYDSCTYDIFFYGHPNERRKKILEELTKVFGSGLKIGYGCYGEKKLSYIARSKIILNLHYYEKAGLETCRINEILNMNKIIVSEKSPTDKLNMGLYKDVVIFVDEIDNQLSNINLLIVILKQYLNKSTYTEKIELNKKRIKKLELDISKIINDV